MLLRLATHVSGGLTTIATTSESQLVADDDFYGDVCGDLLEDFEGLRCATASAMLFCMVKEQDVASGWCHVGWRWLLLASVVADGSRSHMSLTLSLQQ